MKGYVSGEEETNTKGSQYTPFRRLDLYSPDLKTFLTPILQLSKIHHGPHQAQSSSQR